MNTLQPVGETARNKILSFVKAYWLENKSSPSEREIMEACELSSTSVVHHHLSILERQDKILPRKALQSRTIIPTGMTISFR